MALPILLAACGGGVSQEEFDAVQGDLQAAQARVQSLETQLQSEQAQAAGLQQRLVVDGVATLTRPSAPVDLDKGERVYLELDLFREGQAGVGVPIGEAKIDGVATEPAGTFGLFNRLVFRIFGEGDIYVAALPVGEQLEGAIIGGNGEFSGASGEFSFTITSPGVFRHVFTFED